MAKAFTVILLLILILLGGTAAALFLMSSHTSVAFDPPPASIGIATPVSIRIANDHGIRAITARIETDGNSIPIGQVTNPINRFTFWRAHAAPEIFHFTVGKGHASQLKEGKARLIVEVQSNDLRAMTDRIATDVDVILRPPTVTTDGFQHYINQGGSELALISPSGSWKTAGVRVGSVAFRSFPVPVRLSSAFPCLLIAGIRRSIRLLSSSPAATGELRLRPGSGSRFSPRSFVPVTCRSMTPSWKKSTIKSIPAVLEIW